MDSVLISYKYEYFFVFCQNTQFKPMYKGTLLWNLL